MRVDFLIGYITVLITGMVYVFCYQKLTRQRILVTVPKVFIMLFLSAVTIVNNWYNVYNFKMFISFFIIYLICKTWFNGNSRTVFYYSFVMAFIAIMIEFVLCKFYSNSFGSMEEINQSIIAKNSITIICSTLLYFIVAIPFVNKLVNKIKKLLSPKIKNEVLVCCLLILVNFLMMQYNWDYRNNFVYILTVSIILIFTILIILLLRLNYNKEKLEIKNKYLNNNVKNYEVIADDYSELKHNLNHDFMAIRSIANEEAQVLIDEIIKKYNKNYSWTTNIGKIPKGIQGIVCIKLYEVNKENINIEVNSEIDEHINKKIKPKLYSKLCDTLGITIDNAITSARRSKEKSIYIDMQEMNNILEIKIMNTFKDELDLEMLGTKNYSTKKKKSGIGLNYLNKIIKKDFQIKKEIINNIFIVSLLVSLK